jgi:GNAT superfamily N-acetyltransferase
MGVDPAAQGHGIGSAMLAAVLERADREGFPAYLEASCPENQRLYERHGFITVDELNVSDCPAICPIWRSPAG